MGVWCTGYTLNYSQTSTFCPRSTPCYLPLVLKSTCSFSPFFARYWCVWISLLDLFLCGFRRWSWIFSYYCSSVSCSSLWPSANTPTNAAPAPLFHSHSLHDYYLIRIHDRRSYYLLVRLLSQPNAWPVDPMLLYSHPHPQYYPNSPTSLFSLE